MRGEKYDCPLVRFQLSGSSPHARGKDFSEMVRNGWLGIIPACAGKSFYLGFCKGHREDHPRMRGEKPLSCTFS